MFWPRGPATLPTRPVAFLHCIIIPSLSFSPRRAHPTPSHIHHTHTQAVKLGKPWVLDPVGCGATPYRTAACAALLRRKPAVVRGNASEVMALAGAAGGVKGVDSTAASHEALEAAKALARDHGCVVAVSGAVDLVTDGARVLGVRNGTPVLTAITAAGCSVTALIAAFLAAAPEAARLEATAAALAVFG